MHLLIDKTINQPSRYKLHDYKQSHHATNEIAVIPITPIPLHVMRFDAWNLSYGQYVTSMMEYIHTFVVNTYIPDFEIMVDFSGIEKTFPKYVYNTSINRNKNYRFLK